MQDAPKIYLITPEHCELSFYASDLAEILDEKEIACLRLGLKSSSEEDIKRHVDCLRDAAHARDVPVLIDTHYLLVEQLGLDGVHLAKPASDLRKVREVIGKDAILGNHCGTSRHEGLTAGEIGVDYVCFGPVEADNLTPEFAEKDLFEWWSEMVEVPIVAEGNISDAHIIALRDVVDFFCFGQEIWATQDKPKTNMDRIFNLIEAL
ncbi:MAG: thiamine phosphate synthase [Pseudomonadota bacterium]